MKRSTYPVKPQKHAKTYLSEVSTDHEVTHKHCQTDVIRKEDLCGVLLELSDLCKPDQFFGMNLWMNWSVWCIHEGSVLGIICLAPVGKQPETSLFWCI